AALLPADYCQRGLPFTSSGGRTESVWKHDIRLGCKALRLKAKDADQIDYCQLGKLAVVKASNQNKALADFQSEPRRASADSAPPPRLGAPRWQRQLKSPIPPSGGSIYGPASSLTLPAASTKRRSAFPTAASSSSSRTTGNSLKMFR